MIRLAILAAVLLLAASPVRAQSSCRAVTAGVNMTVPGMQGLRTIAAAVGIAVAGGSLAAARASGAWTAEPQDTGPIRLCPPGAAVSDGEASGGSIFRPGVGDGQGPVPAGRGGAGRAALDPRAVAAIAVPLILALSAAVLVLGRRRERRAERHSMAGAVTMRGADGRPGIARFLDISCSGARLILPAPAEPGCRIGLTLNGRQIAARVVWCKDRVAGVAFEPALDLHQLEDIRAGPGSRQSA